MYKFYIKKALKEVEKNNIIVNKYKFCVKKSVKRSRKKKFYNLLMVTMMYISIYNIIIKK